MTYTKTLLLSLTTLFIAAMGLLLISRVHAKGDCETVTHCQLMERPVHKSDLDEPLDERRERLLEAGNFIDAATDNRKERDWLVMTSTFEAHNARYVYYDWPKCIEGKLGECDSGRSWSVFQLQRTNRPHRSEAPRMAIEAFRRGANWCRAQGYDYWEGGTSAYARGNSCTWKPAKKRVAFMNRLARYWYE